MNRRVSYRPVIRLLAVLASAVGLNIACATSAQAAGNVEVREQGEVLIITGDDSDNNIIIQEGGLVTGRADTTVTGSVQGEIHDVVIRMRGGDDFVRVDAGPGTTVFRDLKIETGMGDDTIEILGVRITHETQIDTGDGNDILLIDVFVRLSGSAGRTLQANLPWTAAAAEIFSSFTTPFFVAK